jgi:hypothetical protein
MRSRESTTNKRSLPVVACPSISPAVRLPYPQLISFPLEGFMDVLVAIEREEKKLEKQLSKLQRQLNGVRSAADGLGHSTEREMVSVKNRVCRLLAEPR